MHLGQLISTRQRPFFSLEFFPPKESAHLPKFFENAARLSTLNPLFASVTYGAGGSNQEGSLNILKELKQRFDLELMAHLTCIGASCERLNAFISELQGVGITNILALRGVLPVEQMQDQASSPFNYAEDLVSYIRRAFPSLSIGVAAYPAPHPESPSFASDWQHTVDKIKAGADFAITQLFFDVREYFSLTERLQELGVNVPIIPGILPVQSMESLRRTLALCGANIPGKLFGEFEAAHAQGGNLAVKEFGINFAIKQIRTLLNNGAPGIHLYTLNQAETCLQIVQEVKI